MNIRQEAEKDYTETEKLTEVAFRSLELSDHNEHFLVHRLRQSKDFIPELSLVAEMNNKIVGHILFSRIAIIGKNEIESLILAPVSVFPEYQGQGIGGNLIMEGLVKAKDLGFTSVILVGHSSYYPRFGFEKASKWGIRCSFDVPDEALMANELVKDALQGKEGVVKFSEAFGF